MDVPEDPDRGEWRNLWNKIVEERKRRKRVGRRGVQVG